MIFLDIGKLKKYDRELKSYQKICEHPENMRTHNTADEAKWACNQCGYVHY